MKIKACSHCGNPAMVSCYHDGHELPTLWMDSAKAKRLLDATEREKRAELDSVITARNRIVEQENCNHQFADTDYCVRCYWTPPK